MTRSDFNEVAKVVFGVLLLLLVLAGMVRCTISLNDDQNAKDDIREANGGIIPGKEALIVGNGDHIPVMTILHEGTEYTCFKTGHGLGCIQESQCD